MKIVMKITKILFVLLLFFAYIIDEIYISSIDTKCQSLTNYRIALEAKYQYKIGNTVYNNKTIRYVLLSLNKGKNWYVVDNNKIIGEADEVYPGLLDEIENLEKFKKLIPNNYIK